ncbi:MAG TPA: universal stress protein [Panacibacter sp.]|nr:universal stress protein [Panacibacter sp.]
MAKIIVVTNFSDASRNALDYACAFLHSSQTNIVLLNIFSFSGSLSGDGIAIAAMSETIANDEQKLQQEYKWVKENYPAVNIQTEMVTGAFMEALQDKTNTEEIALVVVGAGGDYADLLSWDTNIINAFVDLHTPVLVIPRHVSYRPIHKIAFACNYYRKNLHTPIEKIRRLVQFTGAQLFVIHVVAPTEIIDENAQQSKQHLQQSLADLSPQYFEPSFADIITAIDNFTAAENIDLLIVIPTRHGLWHNIFQQNHTKGLVHINHLPLLSLRQEGSFI